MNLFIPACGDRLTLTEPWSFDLYLESRNIKFAHALKVLDMKAERWNQTDANGKLKRVPVSLPAGTVLECDRVYIRSFNKSRVRLDNDYDSVTWKVIVKDKGKGRFWVKLPACYEIHYELSIDSLYRDRIKVFKDVHES